MSMDRAQILDSLLRMGIPDAIVADFPELPNEIQGILIYGSQARGDAVPGSDLDVLALVHASRPSTQAGSVNISYYTRSQLATGIGTLFGAHLRRDARIIWDDEDGELKRVIQAMGDVEPDRLLARAKSMSELFTNLDRDLPKYLDGLVRQARYLLRSCLYAQAIAADEPCFSVRELALRHGDPQLADLLSSRPVEHGAQANLDECLARLRDILGEFPPSGHGSLEATIVNEWGRPSDLLAMAFMSLGSTGIGSDYAEMEKVLL